MEVGSMIPRRTRSQSEAYYRRLHDTIKNPYRRKLDQENNFKESWKAEIDDDDDAILISDDDEEDEEIKKKRKYVEGKKRVGRPTKKARARKQLDFSSLLEGEDNMGLVRENIELGGDHGFPLKFKFEDDGEQHKTEWEMEIDHLFDDLELGLWQSEANANDSCAVSDDEDESPAARCSRNDHDKFLDEQIGIICRFCHAVLLDIKYVLPPFCVEPPERERDTEKRWEEESMNCEYPIQDCGNLECISSSRPSTSRGRGTVFDLIPTSSKELYPHQLEGLEFMWRNIAGDIHLKNLQSLPRDGGRGCIISHAPGTGKTRLTIVFLQTLLRLYPKCRPLLVAPRGLLLTWAQELTKWDAHIPFHNLNLNHNPNQILSWLQGGSILGVGYRFLAQSHQFNKTLLESTSLVILDEGHTPRNHHTLTWKLLTKLTTRRRVILSGTLFQNNFHELYNTLSLVNPSFSHHQSKWANLTNSINDEAISKLRAMIQPFIHTYNGAILHKTLPGLQDSLIILKPTPLQQKLLHENTTFIHNFLQQAHLASLISLHPSLVSHYPAFAHHKTHLESLQSDPNSGIKTRFLINLVQISSTLHEKVLIFSDFINPLLHIKKLLKSHLAYNEGREVIYIDGQLSMKQRQSLITSFNDSSGEGKVLLASQRACCEGISLVGASRVVLLDVSWNPSVERQAVCRAYRLGQHKMVYVYHLITMMEVDKYARQTQKDRISELLFKRAAARGEGASCTEGVCEDRVLEAMLHKQGCAAMFERILHHPKDFDLVNDFGSSFLTS